VSRSSTARVQAFRQRRSRSVRSVRVELAPDQIAALVDKGYLEVPKQSDDHALQQAVQSLVSDALLGTILV
jgi:hypothetical protein